MINNMEKFWAMNGRIVMTGNGKAIVLLIGLCWLFSSAQATEVTDVRVETGDGQIRFVLDTDSAPPDPTVFVTEQPPRIVLELPGTSTRLRGDRVAVGVGPAQSYMALSAGGRTRLVVDLNRSVSYTVDVGSNRVTLAIDAGSAGTRPAATQMGQSSFEISGIDFRRGADGESRVLIDLNQSGVNMTVNERANGLR
ncbi:MAG: AMIN domain-containing protein, partial [Wenzhouxiangella sp.]|nr:AMIN domain-containing protein [Wenzhouxiangella sp.]